MNLRHLRRERPSGWKQFAVVEGRSDASHFLFTGKS